MEGFFEGLDRRHGERVNGPWGGGFDRESATMSAVLLTEAEGSS